MLLSCVKDDLKDITVEDNMFHPDNGAFIVIDSATREHIAFGNAIFTIYGRADFSDAINQFNLDLVVKKDYSELYVLHCLDGNCNSTGTGNIFFYNDADHTFEFKVTLVDYMQAFTFSLFLRQDGVAFTNKPSIIVPY